MNLTSRRSGARAPRWSAWSWAVAVAVTLGTAACAGVAARGHPGADAPGLQPFQIRTVQRELEIRGYRAVQPTGQLDEPTRSALAEFQGSRGLPRTGQLDRATADDLGVNLDPRYNCEMNNTLDCGPAGY